MGLDNIPKQYPCKTQGTVVMTPRLNKDGVALTEDDGSPMMVIDCTGYASVWRLPVCQ